MILLLVTLIVMILIALYTRFKPVKELKYLDEVLLHEKIKDQKVQVLDIRDPLDYFKNHLPGAINIYIGRLPHVRKTELNIKDEIVIVSSSEYNIKKAARNLLKSGFCNLSSFVWVEKSGHL